MWWDHKNADGREIFSLLSKTTGYIDVNKFSSFSDVIWDFSPLPISLCIDDRREGKIVVLGNSEKCKLYRTKIAMTGKTYLFTNNSYKGVIICKEEYEPLESEIAWHFANAMSFLGSKVFKWSELISLFHYDGYWLGVLELDFSNLSPIEKRKVVLLLDRLKSEGGICVRIVKDYPSKDLVVFLPFQVDAFIGCLRDELMRNSFVRNFFYSLDTEGITPQQLGRVFAFFKGADEEDWECYDVFFTKRESQNW